MDYLRLSVAEAPMLFRSRQSRADVAIGYLGVAALHHALAAAKAFFEANAAEAR